MGAIARDQKALVGNVESARIECDVEFFLEIAPGVVFVYIGSEVGRDVLPLAGGHIDLDEPAAAASRTIANAVDDVWIFRIGSIEAEFRRRQRAPVSEVHLSPVAAARNHYGAGVLLRTHDVVGICAVGGYVVELRNDLGVPEAPGAAVVQGDAGALVGP